MPTVRTVLGAIHPEQMGVTAMCGQVVSACPAWVSEPEWSRFVPRLFAKWDHDLVDFRSLGGRTVVAGLGAGIKRDMELYRLLSRATGVNIIAATGDWGESTVPTPAALTDIDYFAGFFSDEIKTGIGGTRVKAGVIEINAPSWQLTALEEVVLRAAARVSRETGCSLLAHGVFTIRRQADIFDQEGAAPGKVVFADCDDARGIDPERDKELCQRGFCVGYLHVGSEPTWMTAPNAASDYDRAGAVKAMIEAGEIDRVILSAGPGLAGLQSQWATPYDSVAAGALLRIIPKLYRIFITDDQIDKILIENPKRLLPF